MVFLYDNIILTILFIVFVIMFLLIKKRSVNIISGLGIIFTSFILGLPPLLIGIIAFFVVLVTFNYMRNPKGVAKVMVFLFFLPLLIMAPLAEAAKDDAPGQNKIDHVERVDNVKHVERVDTVTMITGQPSMSLTGTDYAPFDQGKIQAFLTKGNYPIDNGICYVSALYPNITYFLENELMTPISLPYFVGLHYYDFTVPNTTGVYPVNAHCFYNGTLYHDQATYFDTNITIGSSNPSSNLMVDLLSIYHFDEPYDYNGTAGEITDDGPSQQDGTAIGDTEHITPGRFGSGIVFNNINAYGDLGNTANNTFEDRFTVTMWARPRGTFNQWMTPISKGSGGWGDWSMGMNIDDGWALFKLTNSSGTSSYNGYYGSPLYSLGDWVFLAGTYNGTHSTIYISNTTGANLYSNSAAFQGDLLENPANSRKVGTIAVNDTNFNETMDEVGIWKRALTPEEINYIYEEGVYITYDPPEQGGYNQYLGGPSCDDVMCGGEYEFYLDNGFYDEFLNDFRSHFRVWTSSDAITTFWAYNYDTSNKDTLFTITENNPFDPTAYQDNLNESYVSENNTIKTGFEVYDLDNGELRIYDHYLTRVYNGSYVGDLRGSEELVVSWGFAPPQAQPDEQLIDSTSLFNVLWLIICLGLVIGGFYAWAGVGFVGWVIIFSNNIYISMIVLTLSIVLVWVGWRKNKE